MSNYKEELKRAIADARQKRAGTLHDICRARGMTVRADGGNCYAHPCPGCEKKDTFKIFTEPGRTTFRCHNTTCDFNKGGDEIEFFSRAGNMNRRDATRAFLYHTGVEHPYDRWKQERAKRDADPKPAGKPRAAAAVKEPEQAERSAPETEEEETPDFIRMPASPADRTPYEAAWELLELTPTDRQELHAKRAMSDGWIRSFGMKSADKSNLQRLLPLIDQFPPNVLLRSGLVTRGRDQELRISRSLAGYQWNKETRGEDYRPTQVIPYLDAAGRIVLLRPHKASLSNKNWRENEVISGFYEKLHNNLRIPFGMHLLNDRPQSWKHTCVVCEGEYKAMALRMCGIPAVAFQGIHFFLQGQQFKQAINDTAELLRGLDIREVLIVFDNEDKSHKDFHERFEAEIFARYTAECLEDKGFKALYGMLPDDWREGGKKGPDGIETGGKADWDSRLAWHAKRRRSIPAGRADAALEFAAFLSDRSERDGHAPAMQEPPRQVTFLDPKEDVITQALHKLRHEPKIFVGGKHEHETANELENWCHEDFKDLLKVSTLAAELRDTRGGYYRVKPPSEAMELRCINARKEIKKMLEEAEEAGDEDEIRKLRAAKTAAWIILNRYPKPFTDFTARSYFKVHVREENGRHREDRLIRFTDRNGRVSPPFQMPPTQMGSSQKLREFFLAMGGFHWKGNQDECDMWVADLDVHNYQRTIEEVETYGWQKDKKFYLLGDCAIAEGHFIFPDKNGIIWYKGSGYKMSFTTAVFTAVPPMLFPGEKNPKAACAALDWEEERTAAARIWTDALADYHESFGGYAGYAVLAGIIGQLAHAEQLAEIGGKFGMWVNGEKGSGKTKSVSFAMRMLGFVMNYGFFSLGSTKVSIERTLSQMCNLPSHIDEFRNENSSAALEDLLRNAHNEVATIKGTPNGGKGVRKSVPLNIPVVTGEDATTDTALRSRYLRITASKSYGRAPKEDESAAEIEARTAAETKARDARYFRIMERSEQYFRVGRYLFKNREEFARLAIEGCKSFCNAANVAEKIPDARARQLFGAFFGALTAVQKLLVGEQLFGADTQKVVTWFISHGSESSEDTERDVFRTRFFAECLTMIRRKVDGVDQYLRVHPGHVDPATGKLLLYPISNDSVRQRLYVLIAAGELFDEYKADKRRRGENAPLARDNIMAELRAQPAWVKAPKAAPRQHKCSIPGEKGSNRTWWVLDYKLCDPDLRDVFKNIWERELDQKDLMLAEDGVTVVSKTTQALGF